MGSSVQGEEAKLKLAFVALSANKLVKECIEEEKVGQGGNLKIGKEEGGFFVGVLGFPSFGGRYGLNSVRDGNSTAKRDVEQHFGKEEEEETK